MINIDKIFDARKLKREQNRKKWTDKIIKLQRRVDGLDDDAADARLLRRARLLEKRLKVFEPMLLESWMLHDTWTKDEGLFILCDLDPKRSRSDALEDISSGKFKSGIPIKTIVRLDNVDYGAPLIKEIMGKVASTQAPLTIKDKYENIKKLWNSGEHTQDRYAPVYFLSWAVSKKIKITWADWALRKGYVTKEMLSLSAVQLALLREAFVQTDVSISAPPSSGESRVYWRILINDRIGDIDQLHGGKAEVTQVIRWLKANGGKRIIADESIEKLYWLDDNNGRQAAGKKSISNAISEARSSRKVPA
ncbi:hypothetical protein [Janthinobacterium sp. MDT1-19]|uniref:hypothetical protein n=1 Tax=Janthinobacterium sp. MDT1-19 TaxID=1259339 RepID=UPI003F23A8D1